MFRHILFDLDGTLTKSELGIIESVEYALGQFGIQEPDREKLKRFIGPPLFYSFQEYYGFDDKKAEEAIDKYREFYLTEGLYLTPLYEGIRECLEVLAQEHRLYIVTAKPEKAANMIVDNLKIRAYLTAVVGPDPSIKKSDKSWLIERALKEQNITDKSGVVMVGDREYDIKGAKDVGIASIGVLYGYGFREELEGAGADHIVETVDDLQKLLLSQ